MNFIKNKITSSVIIFIVGLASLSCSTQSEKPNRVIIGISADIDTINPLYAFTFDEGNIVELLFQRLVRHDWNHDLNEMTPINMLAEKIEWTNDKLSVMVKIKEDVHWSDGTLITTDDIIFSFIKHSDPEVRGRLLGFFENYYLDKSGKIDESKSFEKISDYRLKINFKPGSKPTLFDIDHPLIPMHIFSSIPVNEYISDEINQNPITNGPFKLNKWIRNQYVSLVIDSSSTFFNPKHISELVFKVIPNYENRILQLKSGEIDLIEEVKNEDAAEIKSNKDLVLNAVKGREYDYVGWNNIDPKIYSEQGKITRHKIFADKSVRRALSYALNKEEIFTEFLLSYGELAEGPVSSIFRINKDIEAYKFNPQKSKRLLKDAGWSDSDNNGILDKNGIELKFTLSVPIGYPRREFAANIFKNNLTAIGADVNLESFEMGIFIDKLFAKEFDAWIVGWLVPLPLNLRPYWHSNIQNTPMNFVSYQNVDLDKLLDELEFETDAEIRKNLLLLIQKIFNDDQPVTFLYWLDNLVAYNSQIKNIDVNPLGVIHNCWEWSIQD